MSPRLRVLVGIVTTGLVGTVGMVALAEGSLWLGGLLMIAAIYRGTVLVRQIARLRELESAADD